MVDIELRAELRWISMRSLGKASSRAFNRLRIKPLIKPLTQFWRVLFYNSSSLKLDSIFNFPNYQYFTRASTWASAQVLHRALPEALPKAARNPIKSFRGRSVAALN